MRTDTKRGFTIAEILVSAGLIALAVTAVISALQGYLAVSQVAATETQASLLVEEAAEALQLMRDAGWTDVIAPLSLGTSYHLEWDGSSYKATTTPIMINSKFTRTFTFSEIQRDGGDNITETGTIDSNTRKVLFQVFTTSTTTPILQAESLIHNVYDN